MCGPRLRSLRHPDTGQVSEGGREARTWIGSCSRFFRGTSGQILEQPKKINIERIDQEMVTSSLGDCDILAPRLLPTRAARDLQM